ncbi:MAG TPA: M20/M25/M40 family metallo-hydrolase [Blastocatellia bacterium]|nr:M20/M25/M40 family metallo-hydrolase [Blastocatellia bacterium]
MTRRLTLASALLIALSVSVPAPALAIQSSRNESATSRLIGEVFAAGQQMRYLSTLSDEVGSRLTGSAGARRAEEMMEAEMKRIGLENVRRESFTIPISWERGPAQAWLISHGTRPLTVASYTWTPGTAGLVEGDVVEVGAGRPEDVERVRGKLKGAIVLAVPAGETLDAVIYNFYRTPLLAREIKDAGAAALLIASDKQHAMPYTAPVDFNARSAALPSLSLAREDAGLIGRLIARGQNLRVRLDVRNKLGPAFESTNVVGEIRGRERPDEIVVVGAHLDSNDLGPGALDNAAGCGAAMETARAIKSLGLAPRRTIRFVLFTGEEEGMLGSNAYVARHRDEMDKTVAALIMDVGAGRPLGWFSMGRTDLDDRIRELMKPFAVYGVSTIEHAAFAATDNAAFMAEGVPNLILLQDESLYFTVHHSVADTPDKADPRDYATCVATVAASTFMIADRADRFGRRLSAEEVRKMAAESKVDEQWRAAGIWK